MMMNYATMGIILDWSALWLTKDLLVPLYLGGAVSHTLLHTFKSTPLLEPSRFLC